MASAFNFGPEFRPDRVFVSRRAPSCAPPNGLGCGSFESGIDPCGGSNSPLHFARGFCYKGPLIGGQGRASDGARPAPVRSKTDAAKKIDT